MDPQAILSAANTLSLPALALVVMASLIYSGIRVVGWGGEVTKLLGNHLRHDLAAQTESLTRIEKSMSGLEENINEQTLVLRALGRMLMERQTGRKDF